MATLYFDTITAAQAAAVTSGDTIIFQTGSAASATVSYVAAEALTPAFVRITVAGKTLDFSDAVVAVSQANNLNFNDGSFLKIGAFPGSSTAETLEGVAAAADGLFGGDGADSLSGGSGNDLLQGNQGNDILSGGNGSDTIYGGQDSDTIDAGLGANAVNGNRGDDSITGGAEA
jgi:hypothetical protein